MAINIGSLFFNIAANTKELQPAIAVLGKLRAAVNRTAKAQSKASQAHSKVLNKQEISLRRAIQATKKHQDAIRAFGAANKQSATIQTEVRQAIDRSTRALDTHAAALGKTNLKSREYARSMETFKEKMDEAKKSMGRLKGGELHGLSKTMRQLESASVLAIGPLSGLGARIRSLGAIANRGSVRMAALIGTVVALTVAFFKLSVAGIQAARTMNQAKARFEAGTGSLKLAREQMEFVTKTAKDLGLRIDVSARSFSRLTAAAIGTSLAGEKIRNIFLSISQAAAALRLGQGEVEGIFRAIEQMISKGTVQAEELRGQLGERLPGAFRLWAVSMGITTQALGKLLKKGEVFAESDLVKFGEIISKTFAAKARDNLDSYGGAMNTLHNAVLEFNIAFDKTSKFSKLFILAVQQAAKGIDVLTEALKKSGDILTAFAVTAAIFTSGFLLVGILKVGKAIILTTRAMIGLNAAIAANPVGGLATAVKRLLVFLAVWAAAYVGIQFLSEDLNKSLDETEEKMDALGADITGNPFESFGKGFIKLNKELMESLSQIEDVQAALQFKDGGNVNLALKAYETQARVIKALGPAIDSAGRATERYMWTSIELSDALNRGVGTSLQEISAAFLELDLKLRALQDQAAFEIARPEHLKDANRELEVMAARLAAMSDTETLMLFDKIVEPMRQYREEQEKLIGSGQELNDIVERREKLLLDTLSAQLRLKQVENERKEGLRQMAKEEADLLRSVGRYFKGMRKASEATELLRKKVKALASGPDSLEVFEKVTRPLEIFTNRLREQVGPWVDINAQVAEYKRLLEEQMILQGPLGQLATNTANAMGNAIERWATATESLSDSFRNLAAELWRLLLRALILDPIVKSIAGGLTGIFTGGGGAGGASGGFGNILTGLASMFSGAATGGASGAAVSGGGSTFTGGFAHGGIFRPNKNILVGEDGPEILRTGSTSGRIFSNDEVKSASRNRSDSNITNITLNLPAQMHRTTAMQVGAEVARVQRRASVRNA